MRENTYNVSMKSERSGIFYTYTVHIGAEFGIECSSLTTTEDQLAGEITWYKKTTVSGMSIFTYICTYQYKNPNW